MWVNRVYTPTNFEIQQNDLVIDIGAHIGIFSLFASKFSKNGIIYAFEPVDKNLELLHHNIKINNAHNIIPIDMAVSDKTGQKALFLYDKDTGSHSFYHPEIRDRQVIVQTTTLKDFVKLNKISRIDFLKIDCEGAEYSILRSCPDNIFKIIRKIILEYHNIESDWNILHFKKFLREKGYTVKIKSGTANILYAFR